MHNNHFPFIEIPANQFNIPATTIQVPNGWEAPKGFPNCCPFHKSLINNTEDFLTAFPNCCDEHRQYAHRFGILPGSFDYLKEKVVNQMSYIEYIIETKINNEDWFEDITDYFEYNLFSFGSPGIGLHLLRFHLILYLQKSKAPIPKYKRTKLLNYLDPKTKKTASPNFNVLRDLYNKWIDTFPFSLPYFTELKETLSKKLPIVSQINSTNRYNGLTSVKIHTEESIVFYLCELTKNLLYQIKSYEEINKDDFDVNQRKRELLIESRIIKNKALLLKFDKNELSYIKTIKQWLQDEIEFFKEYPLAEVTKKKKSDKKSIPTSLEEITNSGNIQFIMQMLEDLQISENGKFILGERKKGSIRGVVEALHEQMIIPQLTLEISCKLIATRIELELQSKLDHSDTVTFYKKRALEYIRNHFSSK
jgi:hypothetical protein